MYNFEDFPEEYVSHLAGILSGTVTEFSEFDERVALEFQSHIQAAQSERDIQKLDSKRLVWPCSLCDNLQDANVNWDGLPANCHRCLRYICNDHGGVDAEGNIWCGNCAKEQNIVLELDPIPALDPDGLDQEGQQIWDRHKADSVNPLELEDEEYEQWMENEATKAFLEDDPRKWER